MIRRFFYCVSGALCLLVLANCASSTPTSRIQKNPAIYDALSTKEKNLVSQGRIEKGMSKKAVFLAWGRPSTSINGSRNGVDFQRWIYTSYQPVYTNRFYGGYGYGWGRYGRPYYGMGYGPEVDYIPERRAFVEFRNERVHNWERRQ